jgi:hypothetical protein
MSLLINDWLPNGISHYVEATVVFRYQKIRLYIEYLLVIELKSFA